MTGPWDATIATEPSATTDEIGSTTSPRGWSLGNLGLLDLLDEPEGEEVRQRALRLLETPTASAQ